jgi:hypothetical protein
MDPKNQNSFTRHNTKYIFTRGRRPGIQSLTISFIIRTRELNIKLLSDEGGQIFNFRFNLLDGIQIIVIIDFLPKFL